ncbi:MAG: metalloregulator ArsR/SmtB family transcription factor [Planctomycetes bacterium]|nr:metalloregulator ArsR/SmtB family transcription factor [Planctomycetota bacterium]
MLNMSRPLLKPADRVDVFRGVSHPLRRRVLVMLRQRDCTVGELLAAFKVRMPTLSGHLSILRETGLVTQRTSGPHRIYRLKPGVLDRIERWLESFRA